MNDEQLNKHIEELQEELANAIREKKERITALRERMCEDCEHYVMASNHPLDGWGWCVFKLPVWVQLEKTYTRKVQRRLNAATCEVYTKRGIVKL